MRLIVGLGNPGREYVHTRHNVGFDVLDVLAGRQKVAFRSHCGWPVPATWTDRMRAWFLRHRAWTAGTILAGEQVLLVKPATFMNASGEAVAPLMVEAGLGLDDLVVVVDDAELEAGRLRIRKKGSAGGHNGLKSLVSALGSDAFARVRVGVGRPLDETDMVEHVLQPCSREERAAMKAATERAADAVTCLIAEGADVAMNKFNG